MTNLISSSFLVRKRYFHDEKGEKGGWKDVVVRPAAIGTWPTPTPQVGLWPRPPQGWGTCAYWEVSTMSSTVKSLKVTYNPINETNTFTNGDTVSGQVTLEVTKDCQISSLSVKFKGKAKVMWSERHGNTTVVYHSKEKYFTIKHYFIHDKKPEGE